MKKMLAVVFSFMFLGLVGCASSKVASNQVQITVLETVPKGNQPKWVKEGKDFYEEDGKMFYVAVSEGFGNIEASKRASAAAVQTTIVEQVKKTISVEFGRSLEAGAYEGSTGGYLKDVFMSNVDKVQVSGIVIESTYSERIQEQQNYDSKIYWRTYSLASIPKTTFEKLIQKAFEDTSKQVEQNKSAKEMLEEAEKRFYNK